MFSKTINFRALGKNQHYLPRLLTYHIPLRWLPGEPYWTSDTPTTSPLGLHITAST
ncbi:hypothetical protein J6590_090969 [Homalodisca vitripennis]|nr:hypothetical protein J6590_091909 [Homalodisca vitripennis]KAG8294972.1 hypothetical protein J6590_090969 [Homalodisca vitripennis]